MLTLYLILALPTLFVVLVIKPTGDTNGLMWLSNIVAMLLGLPWLLFFLSSANQTSALVLCFAINSTLIWALTRRRNADRSSGERPADARPYGIYDENNQLLPQVEAVRAVELFDLQACNRLLRAFGESPSSKVESLEVIRLRCIATLKRSTENDA